MNEIIDFGEIKCPTSWNDITLKQFQQIELFYDGKDDKQFNIIDVLDILIEKPRDFIMDLPTEFLDRILEKIRFISEPIEENPSNIIEIDGEKYSINTQNKLRTGEYVAVDAALKGDERNYAAILAILCRKSGEKYDSTFENEILDDRIKMFESLPITKVMPLISFFLDLYVTQASFFLSYSKAKEALNLMQENIESSQSLGACKRSYLKWQIQKLRKSLESIKTT